jgi:hypothetical protein
MAATIQVQQVGKVQAKPAAQFKAGDQMVWNFGYTSTILAVASETKAFITYLLKDNKTSASHERRLKKTRLVAFI